MSEPTLGEWKGVCERAFPTGGQLMAIESAAKIEVAQNGRIELGLVA